MPRTKQHGDHDARSANGTPTLAQPMSLAAAVEAEIAVAQDLLRKLVDVRDLLAGRPISVGSACGVMSRAATPIAPIARSTTPTVNKDGTPRKKPGRKPKVAAAPPHPEKPKSRTMPVADADRLAFKLGVYLKANGPKRRDALRNELDITDMKLDEILERPWFEKDGAMWTLSSDGHVHFRQDAE